MNQFDIKNIQNLGQLKASGYEPISVKEELRRNLVTKLKRKEPLFDGIYGYEKTVIPDVERAILSGHNFILLGLRGQAKTRIARRMVELLDEYVPVVQGSEINDDPLQPLSRFAKDLIAELGDNTPITWWHRSDRFTEKLATPDVSVADLIGDTDPIKAASLKIPYSDERAIHFGLIPRSHRCLFVMNELPDLQARIQVALFNILQEGDIQIRGFRLRLPLDIQFVFTANPEDYTNRGAIITPLKDRIESQILTHYPSDLETGKRITRQEARLHPEQQLQVYIPEPAENFIEQLAIEARRSEFVDQKSGVSARLTISAMENLVSAAERRLLLNDEATATVRCTDFWGIIPSITGKVELVYEGEQEGPLLVALQLLGKAFRAQFPLYFPEPVQSPARIRKADTENTRKAPVSPYAAVVTWFNEGNELAIDHQLSEADYKKALSAVPGLSALVQKYHPALSEPEKLFMMEFVLHGLAAFSQIGKKMLHNGARFGDLLSAMLESEDADQEE